MLPSIEQFVLPMLPVRYLTAGQRLTGLRHSLGLDFRRGSATLSKERPRVVPRGLCFDPVRRVSSAWFENSPSRSRGAVAQLGERCNRTAEVRGSIPLSSTVTRIRQVLPLGVTGNTPDSGSGESWFEPRRGNWKAQHCFTGVGPSAFLFHCRSFAAVFTDYS
jgi:hypothetical protein